MTKARSLKRSRTRYRGGGFRGAGTGNWQIALLVVFCVVGLISLGYMLSKMVRAEIRNWRDIRRYSAFLFIVTLSLIIPAIILLALSTSPAVGTLSIISLCLLITPLLIWILIAVRKSRHIDRSDSEREMTNASADPVYTTYDDKVEGRPFPAYNLA